jgi:hypothetical protein
MILGGPFTPLVLRIGSGALGLALVACGGRLLVTEESAIPDAASGEGVPDGTPDDAVAADVRSSQDGGTSGQDAEWTDNSNSDAAIRSCDAANTTAGNFSIRPEA